MNKKKSAVLRDEQAKEAEERKKKATEEMDGRDERSTYAEQSDGT